MLQPLVENAVKYGIESRQSGGSIHVTTQVRDECVDIRILDPGPGMDAHSVEGVGIGNVKARLRAAIEGASLNFVPRPEGGLETLIVLPRTVKA